jgi:hypothetical protein
MKKRLFYVIRLCKFMSQKLLTSKCETQKGISKISNLPRFQHNS